MFPEEVVKRHEPITLDVKKTYPSKMDEALNQDEFVSSEQESSKLEDALLAKTES